MDIFARLDMFEDLIARAKKVPLSSSVLVNEAELFDMIDDIRVTLPNELKEARIVKREKERIIAEAERQAEGIVERAQREAEKLVQEHHITKEAELERDRMLAEAEMKADDITREAEDYADKVFGDLEALLLELGDSLEELIGKVRLWREKLRKVPVAENEEESEYGEYGE